MTEVALLIAEIKRELKSQGITYRDVAQALHMSEPSIKRVFASKRLTVERLVQLCELLGFSLAELAQQAQTTVPKLSTLSLAQEQQLVSNPQLLLVAVCVLNHWTLVDIVRVYAFSEVECLRYLLVLDRLGLIQLMPGNRIRLAVARNFDWIANGPIQRYFREKCQREFLDNPFSGATENLSFDHGMLTPAAQAEIQQELGRLRNKFAELHKDGIALPLDQKLGTGLMLALREWEPDEFTRMRR
ncbi:MAG: transcriptional regulator [Proteobacteria bacterium]|nr:transcriptional regulator [Pseudomonadota bacterium]